MDQEPDGHLVDVCAAQEPCEEDQKEAEECPAVIVEEVPGRWLAGDQSYSSQVLLYSDRTDLKQNVGDEKSVATKMGKGKSLLLIFLLLFLLQSGSSKLQRLWCQYFEISSIDV